MMSPRFALQVVLAGTLLTGASVAGQPTCPVPASDPAQWAQFHGPRRDNVSTETGFLKKWPAKGPKLLWIRSSVGSGYASVAISNERIYTAGNIGDQTVITALGMDGAVLWTSPNGPVANRAYPGSRGTPTVDMGKVYHLAPDGALICLDAEKGKKIWGLNVLQEFKGKNCTWGLSESLLIDGDNLICAVGGKQTSIVALDKKTGKTVWKSKSTGDQPGYASPILVEYKGLRQIVTAMSRSIVSVNADNGKLLWRIEHRVTLDENILTPVHRDGRIFVSGPGRGGTLLRLKVAGKKCTAKIAWRNPKFDNGHGGVVLLGDYLYGHSDKTGALVCVNFKTGKTAYSVKHEAAGKESAAVGLVGDMLYVLSDRKAMWLAPATPDGFKPVSSFKLLPGGRGPSWAHPVAFGGRLYVRHDKIILAYDIRAE